MTNSEAIDFLRQHQPMPDDDHLNEHPELMNDYDRVINYFIDNPDPLCVKLFLNSFGGWNGFGMYQMVEDVFFKFDEQFIINELQKNLKNSSQLKSCTLYWNIQQCVNFSGRVLFEPLAQFINHPLPDIRNAVVYALSQIEGDDVVILLEKQLAVEDDESVIEALEEVLH